MFRKNFTDWINQKMNLFGLTQRNIKFILCLGGEVFDFQKFFQVELNTSVYKSGQKVYLHQNALTI